MAPPNTHQSDIGGGTGVRYPDSGVFDAGSLSDAGTDGGLGLGFPCDPDADGGDCGPDLACQLEPTLTGSLAYSCEPGFVDDAG